MNELLSSPSEAPWETLAPHLDAALNELNDADRDALLLRYFERRSAAEMAGLLGISDEAAQKRVSRAVERLRELFSQRHVMIGAGGLTALISANAVQAAPIGLAAAISASAIAGAAVATSTSITVAQTLVMTNLQKILVTAAFAVLAGAGIYEGHQAAALRKQNQALQAQQARLQTQIQELEAKVNGSSNRPTGTLAKNLPAQSAEKLAELLNLRGQVGALRQQLAAQSGSPAKAIASLLDDPAKKELARRELQKALQSRFASFIQAHNLPPDTVDKLFSIITQNELSKTDRLAALVRGDLDVTGALQDRDNTKQSALQQLQVLLGDETYNQLMEFNRQADANTLVTAINGQMRDNPLTADQSQRLQGLLAAQPDVTVDDVDLFRSQDSLDALYQQQLDRAQNLLQQADSFLNPDQAAALATINSNYWNDIRAKMTLNRQLISSTLGRAN
jgi:hypothetical protein